MAVEAEEIDRIYRQIVLGQPKPAGLSDEAAALWERIAAEVAAAPDGVQFDMVDPEMADLPPWVSEAPEAKNPVPPPGEGEVVASAAIGEAIMPYGIRAGGGDCPQEVYNSDTGERVPGGCHPTRAEALRHQRALMRNVEEAAAVDTMTVEDADLTPEEGEHFHAVMHRQGVSTGRRTFTNLAWRDTPFAYHWQKGSSAHGGTPLTVQVGLVGRVVEVGEDLHAFGPLDLSGPDGAEYARQLVAGFARWVSIGLDEHKPTSVEVVWPDDEGEADGDGDHPLGKLFEEPEQVVIDGGVIGELTGTSIPAQADAEVEPTPELMQMLQAAAEAAFPAGTKANPFKAGGGKKTDEDCPDGQVMLDGKCVPAEEAEETPAKAAGMTIQSVGGQVRVVSDAWLYDLQTVEGASPQERKSMLSKGERFPMHNCVDVGKAVRAVGRAAGGGSGRNQVRKHIIGKARSLGCSDRVPDNWNSDGTLKETAEMVQDAKAQLAHDAVEFADAVEAITAASYRIEIPDLPPAEWFEEPLDVQMPGAFCITDTGRIYGILAPLNTNHRAYAGSGRRMTVPRGNVDYSRFLGGEALTRSGRISGVGPITMDCGHASRFRQSHDVAPAHYDNSCAVLGKARVGETAEGLPWIAGALEPGITPAQISRALACRLSGDWQPHPDRAGWQELVAALLVPSPGFPMGRTGPTVEFSEGVLVASSMPVRHVSEPVYLSDAERSEELERLTALSPAEEWAAIARRLNEAGIPV